MVGKGATGEFIFASTTNMLYIYIHIYIHMGML